MANDGDQAISHDQGHGLPALLRRIPLVLRMVFYGAFFLGVVLGLLPWVSYRLDVYVPAVHVELGWFRCVGGAMLAVCLAVYFYTAYVLAARGRGAYVEFDPPTTFVSTGPYRWVRNPIVACLMGVFLGEAILLSSTGAFLMFLVALLLAHLQVVHVEEPLLRKRFGKSYDDYLARVPRFIPKRPSKKVSG